MRINALYIYDPGESQRSRTTTNKAFVDLTVHKEPFIGDYNAFSPTAIYLLRTPTINSELNKLDLPELRLNLI